jgi:hypothetical protein
MRLHDILLGDDCRGGGIMTDSKERIKNQILAALRHPEAQDGLYFRNFYHLHEEDERPAVEGDEVSILDALSDLMHDGVVRLSEGGTEAIFFINEASATSTG